MRSYGPSKRQLHVEAYFTVRLHCSKLSPGAVFTMFDLVSGLAFSLVYRTQIFATYVDRTWWVLRSEEFPFWYVRLQTNSLRYACNPI